MRITGETLRLWRTMKRLNQHGVAKKLHISQQEYSKWEHKDYIDGQQLLCFLEVCGCTLKELEAIQKLHPPQNEDEMIKR